MENNKVAIVPEFKANLVIRGIIEVKTGLHIGGSKEKMEIGGIDSIVVRSPRTNYPYLPGSSIKGKMRHLLEYFHGVLNNPSGVDNNHPLEKMIGNVSIDEKIVRIFGIGANEKENNKNLEKIGLSRLIVRDAHPTTSTTEMWENEMGSDSFFTEYKAENTIDRLTSAANPRFIERVVEGSKFEFEMIYSAFKIEENDSYDQKVDQDIANIFTGLRLLEASALGGSGTRGYGKIKFLVQEPVWLNQSDYKTGSENWKTATKIFEEDNVELKPLQELDISNLKYSA